MSEALSQTYTYPCPACLDTMLPGVTYTFPRRHEPTKGTGKVWSVYTGAATANPPADGLVDCWRCKGTGMVGERRQKPDRRMISHGRREKEGVHVV